MSSPTSGEKYQIGHIPVQIGQLVGKHFYRKRTQALFGKVEHEAAMYPGRGEGQQHTLGRALPLGWGGWLISPLTSALRRHIIACQWLRLAGTTEDHNLVLPPRARSGRTDCSGLCPVRGWTSPQPSLNTFLVFKHPASKTVFCSDRTRCVSVWAPVRSQAPPLHPHISMNKHWYGPLETKYFLEQSIVRASAVSKHFFSGVIFVERNIALGYGNAQGPADRDNLFLFLF